MTADDLRRAGEYLIALAERGEERETFRFPTGDDSEDPVDLAIEATRHKQAGFQYRWRVGKDEGTASSRDGAIFWAGYWHRDRELDAI